jgi:hypothetical protein
MGAGGNLAPSLTGEFMDVPLTALSADEVRDFVRDTLPPELAAEMDKPAEPKQKRIAIALLAYDGRQFVGNGISVTSAVVQAMTRGWGVTFIRRDADSMVARGRSFLASQFLTNPESANCTDLVFIDTDLEWSGDEFVRLCSHDVDVVGGAYPFKDETGDFPLQWPSDGLYEENGLWNVKAVTPGFMRISRRALEKMSREMAWLQFNDRGNKDGQKSWMFFDNLHRATGIYDEGYIFCERWKTLGGQVYLDPDMNITHVGLKAYNHGTVREWLNKKAEKFTQLESEHPGTPPLQLAGMAMGEKPAEHPASTA